MPTVTMPPSTTVSSGRMVRFTLQDGMTLEIHIPGATHVETDDSPARTAGFTVRNGDELINVGVLAELVPPPLAPPRSPRPTRRRRHG